ncbi:flagellar FlbD family protein [Paenibacillus lemnae]|uniref:Flagellar FlbD family protein n=1 Tax=Paenibacillus lemnae TaxID=1330551 RepID=A0A848M9J2_PAELE|nr:flagellar FlbD family protein [Paenibacillus lemnae]NMO96164.1 flagellar FlbD family protein [Paenibacillus lemnae]
MIPVTRLNGSQMWLNALLIEMVEETPDTYITLTTGKRLIVLEKAADVVQSIRSYHHEVGIHQATIKVQQQTEEPS